MFHFRLDGPSSKYRRSGSPIALESLTDYQYLVITGCGLLAETDCRFVIGGFGSEDWQFDTAYDMSSFLEELPELISSLKERRTTVLDLYPPGIERTLTFHPGVKCINIECASRLSNWKPTPEIVTENYLDILGMFEKLALEFACALDFVVPEIGRVPPFSSWKGGVAT